MHEDDEPEDSMSCRRQLQLLADRRDVASSAGGNPMERARLSSSRSWAPASPSRPAYRDRHWHRCTTGDPGSRQKMASSKPNNPVMRETPPNLTSIRWIQSLTRLSVVYWQGCAEMPQDRKVNAEHRVLPNGNGCPDGVSWLIDGEQRRQASREDPSCRRHFMSRQARISA